MNNNGDEAWKGGFFQEKDINKSFHKSTSPLVQGAAAMYVSLCFKFVIIVEDTM